MFHSNTEQLIEYWRSHKSANAAPARASIDPGEFPALAPQVFILGRASAGRYVFRLAGGLVEDLHGVRLGGVDALSLWAETYRTSLQLALEAVRRAPEPLVVTAEARAPRGEMLGLEITFAPLMSAGGEIDRVFGLYQPKTPVAALQGQPIQALTVRGVATARPGDADLPRLRLAAVDGRQIA